MDEIGRGTSTYDGMSLAQAIIEHFVESQKGFTLFSTHYHELTQLESLYPQVQNFHMSAKESQGKLQFQHTLKKGPANQSYGIQVARLAGVPSRVTERARQILQGLEAESFGESKSSVQMDLFQTAGRRSEETPKDVVKENHPMLSELQKMSLSEMTPLEVLMKVNEWQKSLS